MRSYRLLWERTASRIILSDSLPRISLDNDNADFRDLSKYIDRTKLDDQYRNRVHAESIISFS